MDILDLNFIKQRRLELNLTLVDMAQEFGFKSSSTYLKYEQGEYSFKAEHLPILVGLLKCKMNELFTAKNVSKTATK